MERQKYNADNSGPVGERGPAWYDDYTIEELLERIIRDAYAIGEKIGHPPMQDFISKKNRFPRKNDIKYITARKTVPPTVYGTRAVRFKTQRPLYEKCEASYERIARHYSRHDKR